MFQQGQEKFVRESNLCKVKSDTVIAQNNAVIANSAHLSICTGQIRFFA